MTTIGQLLDHLLTHSSPEERAMPDADEYPGRNAAALTAINAALQFLFGATSPWCRREMDGFLLYAPTPVTVTVTQGSKEITFASWDDRYAGCTIRISGASTDNRIHGYDEESGTTTLTAPHDGQTGTPAATVYHDSITLAPTIAEILRPVSIKGVCFLAPVGSPSELTNLTPDLEDYGFHRHNISRPEMTETSASAGTPRLYCVDTHQITPMATPQARLRIWPAPDSMMTLEARVRIAAPSYKLEDIGRPLPIPNDYVESILVPAAEYQFSRSPFFRNDAAKAAIADAYQSAIDLLRTMNPQGASGGRLLAQF